MLRAHAAAKNLSCISYVHVHTQPLKQVERLQVACMLQGGHRGATVTAVKWCPDRRAARDAKTAGASGAAGAHLRLASGDSAGGVVVWDAASGAAAARLDDAPAAQELLDAYAASARGDCGVQGLAWVLPGRGALAVVIAPALLVVWDPAGGGVLWKRELAAPASPETFTSIAVDPLDRRRVVLCGDAGALVVLRLRGVGGGDGGGGGGGGGGGEVEQQQYRVNVAQPASAASASASGAAAQQQQQQQQGALSARDGRETPAGALFYITQLQ